jgi:hypothetical protein
MDYECLFSARDSGWVVEAIDFDKEGVGYRALFTGQEAENRAREYADWKNASTAPQYQRQQRRSAA